MNTSVWETDLSAIANDLRTNGFAVAKGFLPEPLVSQIAAEADALITRFTKDGYRSEDYWCYDVPGQGLPMLYRIHNLERQGAQLISSLFNGGPLHLLAGAMLGLQASQTVCAMVVKTPGVAEVPWHRDRVNVPATAAINLSTFLDPSTRENGCLEVVPGSHLLDSEADLEAVRQAGPIEHIDAQPGDVIIHDVRLVHGSSGNASNEVRRSLIIEFEAHNACRGIGGHDE